MNNYISLKTIIPTKGYYSAFTQPAVVAIIIVKESGTSDTYNQNHNYFDSLYQGAHLKSYANPEYDNLINALIELYMLVFSRHDIPLFDLPEVLISREKDNEQHYTIIFPTTHQPLKLLGDAVDWMCKLISNNDKYTNSATLKQHIKEAEQLANMLNLKGLFTFNSNSLVKAAHKFNIPWLRLTDRMLQVGWGEHSKWFSSSIGPQTSSVSVAITSNKLDTTNLLRRSGLPVEKNKVVFDLESAISAAAYISYPVVLKPTNLAGGRGVYCNIKNADELATAFTKIEKIAKTFFVEKYFQGNDFRFQVYQGKVTWIVQRTPAYVIGDGISTIKELIDAKNKNRYDFYNGIGIIELNDELNEFLENQDLEMSSIIAENESVNLKYIGNIAAGGEITPVLDIAHPDNIELAETATNICRLDIAGVDILLPDITKSWKQSGAHICEVNSQPQMSSHLFELILKGELEADGRIPVDVFVINGLDLNMVDLIKNSICGDITLLLPPIELPPIEKKAKIKNNAQITESFHGAITNILTKRIVIIYCLQDVINEYFYPFDKVNAIYAEDNVYEKFISTPLAHRASNINKFKHENLHTILQDLSFRRIK
jgi:D-alanine-D-alanine ligase-like ATP-grasp enzyme